MCDWGGGPNQAYNYVRDSSGTSPVERAEQATREARASMVQKNEKPPIQPSPKSEKQPVIIKGTIEPTEKK